MISGQWTAGAKTLRLTLDGQTVSEDVISATLRDDINGGSDPKLGTTTAARLQLVIHKPGAAFLGKTLTAAVAGIPLGVFTVTAADAQDERAVIEAEDAMGTAFEGAYTPAAESSTALTVIREICAACGVSVGDVSGVTDVPVIGLAAGSTCRETLGLMAALLGRNAHIDRYGRMALRWYESCGAAVTPDDYYPGELTKAASDCGIDRLECSVVRTVTTTEDGVTTETTETTVLTAGTGAAGIALKNPYMTQTILDGICERIGGFSYRPVTVTFYGDARIETGDILTVTDAAGSSYTVPVMAVTHSWDGGVRTTVQAFGDPEADAGRETGGSLSRTVSGLAEELARFKNLEAENLTVMNARIGTLFADWANIGTAIIDTLEANGINADWINAGRILADYLKLYGSMDIFSSASASASAGRFGYTSTRADGATVYGLGLLKDGVNTGPLGEPSFGAAFIGGDYAIIGVHDPNAARLHAHGVAPAFIRKRDLVRFFHAGKIDRINTRSVPVDVCHRSAGPAREQDGGQRAANGQQDGEQDDPIPRFHGRITVAFPA